MRRWLRNHKFFFSIPVLWIIPQVIIGSLAGITGIYVDPVAYGAIAQTFMIWYVIIGTIAWFIHRKVTNEKMVKKS